MTEQAQLSGQRLQLSVG